MVMWVIWVMTCHDHNYILFKGYIYIYIVVRDMGEAGQKTRVVIGRLFFTPRLAGRAGAPRLVEPLLATGKLECWDSPGQLGCRARFLTNQLPGGGQSLCVSLCVCLCVSVCVCNPWNHRDPLRLFSA